VHCCPRRLSAYRVIVGIGLPTVLDGRQRIGAGITRHEVESLRKSYSANSPFARLGPAGYGTLSYWYMGVI